MFSKILKRFHTCKWRPAKREDFPRPDYPAQFVWNTGRVQWCDGCNHWRLF